MKLVRAYSSKILSARQKVILFSSVSICVFAFSYTYLAVKYMQNAMIISVADTQPHIRLYLASNDDSPKILDFLRKKKGIARADAGVLVEGEFNVVSRHQPTQIGKKGEIHFTGSKKIRFVGYSFYPEEYRPPVFLENVYSKSNRELAERRPNDEPIRIITDQRENEKKENWCIISKNLTSIFPLGPSAFGDLFEVVSINNMGEAKHISFRTAGYLNDSPLTINNSTLPCVIYTKRKILEDNFSN